jgi:hypothetical protein
VHRAGPPVPEILQRGVTDSDLKYVIEAVKDPLNKALGTCTLSSLVQALPDSVPRSFLQETGSWQGGQAIRRCTSMSTLLLPEALVSDAPVYCRSSSAALCCRK